jgi:transposase
MPRRSRFSPEVRERAVVMVAEHRKEYSSQWACVSAVAPKIGVTPQTLLSWVKQAEIDGGARSGLTTDERKKLKELERENKELRRANEILKAASIFFATELDGRPKK